LVETALEYSAGIVSVRVAAGTSEKEIMADAFKRITRSNISFLDHSASARRVLWWHHFLFRQPATVVLQAAERKPTQQYADLDSSARALTHEYGARVLIDASKNSLPEAATATKREKVLELEPMQRELLQKLPELQVLHEALKRASLADVVWMCVGGNPADYKSLLGAWNDQQRQNIEQVVAFFVQDLVGKALDAVSSALASDERLQELFDKFRTSSDVPCTVLKDMGLVRPSPDKVLRAVKLRVTGSRGGGQRFLIPADAAAFIVLRHGIIEVPTFEELKALAVKEL